MHRRTGAEAVLLTPGVALADNYGVVGRAVRDTPAPQLAPILRKHKRPRIPGGRPSRVEDRMEVRVLRVHDA